MPRKNIYWTDDNKLVWKGGFNSDENQSKRNTSVSYIFTFKGSKEYMPLFGQPIQLLHDNFFSEEEYLKYIQSQTFQLNIDTIQKTVRPTKE